MGKETIYRCDYKRCNATRPFVSPTNHWFIIGEPTDSGDKIDGKGFVVMPFPTQDAIDPLPEDDKMFCGENHALAYITQQMWGFYNHLVEAPPVINEPVAPATTGVGSTSAEVTTVLDILHDVGTEHPFEQVPFSDLPAAVERDEFCMDVEDPTDQAEGFSFPPRRDLS